MPSIIPGFEYDIFISYRQKDNKHDGWVTEFFNQLKGELESTFKEDVSIYFDENPHDGLLETHSVDKSLEGKLKCLIFIPVISQTYCDSKSFAWLHEFCAFNKLSKKDQFGRDIKLTNGNVSSRILPVKIHDLDLEDKTLLENELGGVLRSIEFIYKSAGVNRPLTPLDNPDKNLDKTYYRDQINKVANAVKEIITAIKKHDQLDSAVPKDDIKATPERQKNLKTKIILASFLVLALVVLGYFFIPKVFKSSKPVEKSIAVLPFANLSNDPEQEYFSDGMVDQILDHLFKIGDLKVISRTSSMRYKNTKLTLKEIARELSVSAILEGSIAKVGNNVRITAQLIDANTDVHLWSETYDRDLNDIFSIQSDVAQNVARQLKITLTAKETNLIQGKPLTTNQLAYDFYLKGNEYFSKSKFHLAIDMCTKAIKEDTLFAAAYAKRAEFHLQLYWQKSEEEWQVHKTKAQEDIKKGLLLNPELAELKLAQAVYYYYVNRDYDNALKILKELKAEAPSMAKLYGYSSAVLKRQGKWVESIHEREQSLQLDPLDALTIADFSGTYNILHQYDKAIEWSRHGLSLMPDYKNFNLQILETCLDKALDLKIALKESELKEEDVQYFVYYYTRQYDKLIEFIRKDTTIHTSQSIYYSNTFEFALTYYLIGNKSLCKIYADSSITFLKEKLKEMPNDERIYATLGKCYAFIGNTEEAITCGKEAVNLRPIKSDAFQGAHKEQDLMEIYVFTKKYNLAMDKMEYLLSIPSELSVGKLMIDPVFDNLRSLPRFQKILTTEYKTNYQ